MTLKIKRTSAQEKIEEAACDRCGKSLMSKHCPDTHYAVLDPHFGYDSGLDLINEGPNGMRLYFCEICYREILKLLRLEIGCSPARGYHWKEPDIEVCITVGDLTNVDDNNTKNVMMPTRMNVNMWSHLDKG